MEKWYGQELKAMRVNNNYRGFSHKNDHTNEASRTHMIAAVKKKVKMLNHRQCNTV